MDNPKISVIIPAYNAEKTLRECLNSVLNQTYENYEAIVIDNNSTDGTKDIIKEFCNENYNMKYLLELNRGSGAARYRGEVNALGDIILMTDSDCIVPKNWIEEMIEPIVKNGQTAVQGVKKAVKINYWTKHIQDEEERLALDRIKDGKIGLLDTANFAIRKSILQDVGYTNPDIAIGHDTELMVRLKLRGYAIHFKQIEVLHNHPGTAIKVFKKHFERGVWNGRIRKTYKNQLGLFPVTSKTEHLCYLMRLVLELLTLHKNFRYDFVTGIAWRIGLVCGWRKKIIKSHITS